MHGAELKSTECCFEICEMLDPNGARLCALFDELMTTETFITWPKAKAMAELGNFVKEVKSCIPSLLSYLKDCQEQGQRC